MLINFQPIFSREKTVFDLANQHSHSELINALNSYVDTTRQIISDMSDEQVVYIPPDPQADDPHAATETERHVGWNLAHLVLHVTASAEEAAAFSSMLARGVAIGGRLRSERDWRQFTTCSEVIARLEESRRMCLAYLATWPDEPDLDTARILPENTKWPSPNAPVSLLLGLMHWHNHLDQFQKVAEQARLYCIQGIRSGSEKG